MPAAILATLTLASVLQETPQVTAPPSLGDRIVSISAESVGKRFGNGECATFVDHVLRSAKAKPFGSWKDDPKPGDYVWGTRIATAESAQTPTLDEIRPGDILQFRDAKFELKTTYRRETITASHHTAIIETYDPKTGMATLLHSNSEGRLQVARSRYPLTKITQGQFWAYRAVPENAVSGR